MWSHFVKSLWLFSAVASNRSNLIRLPMVVVFLWAISASAQMEGSSPPTPKMEGAVKPPPLGGPCEVVPYKGFAKIISINPRKGSKPLKDEWDIKFVFLPEAPILEPSWLAGLAGGEFFLKIKGRYYPSKEFIDKYDVRIGKIFPCNALVRVKGSCTPLFFEFPFIEESK